MARTEEFPILQQEPNFGKKQNKKEQSSKHLENKIDEQVIGDLKLHTKTSNHLSADKTMKK